MSFVDLDSVHATDASTLIGGSVLDIGNFPIHASGTSEIKLRVNADSIHWNMEDAPNVQLAGQCNNLHLDLPLLKLDNGRVDS